MIRLFITIFSLLFLSISVEAQAPKILNVSPIAQRVNAPTDTPISVDFDMAINPETINNLTFSVFGRWSGPAAGELTFGNNGTQLVFTPSESFTAGEWVTVSLSKGVQNMDGMPLEYGYSWNFWIATAPGSLEQDLVETIQLRNPGEGLIQAYGAYAGDLNNDGFSDLTVINETSDDLRILLNDGTGKYSEFTTYPMGNMTPSPNEGADFNKDGEIDLAVSTAHHNEVRILTGDGGGNFTDMQTYTTGDGARGLVVLDCNGDGWDDIFITNRLDDNISLLTNTGENTFEVTTFDTEGVGETSCAVTDANHDGIPDIFIGMYNSSELGIMLGDGDGGFSLTDIIPVSGQPWMIAAGDVNGDGHPDVVSANSSGNVTAVAFGDGEGGLSEADHYTPTNSNFPLAIDLGDLDGDGDLDMVTSNYASATFTVFENDGTGTFTFVENLSAPDKASCAILHDRDNDGDLDISATDEGDDVVLIFENPGIASSVNTPIADNIQVQLSPNPFSDQLTIDLELASKSELELSVLNSSGQSILSIQNGPLEKGAYQFRWKGQSTGGQLVSAGIYFLEVRINNQVKLYKVNFLSKN